MNVWIAAPERPRVDAVAVEEADLEAERPVLAAERDAEVVLARLAERAARAGRPEAGPRARRAALRRSRPSATPPGRARRARSRARRSRRRCGSCVSAR